MMLPQRVDVHGGWYDASGDVSKHVGCLAESNYMDAQESPMAVWCFLHSVESLRFELTISKEVTNPFGYARQCVKDGGGKRSAFFLTHRNETSYWWLGENSRLASLATAALLGSRFAAPGMAAELRTYAGNQTNWILGLNPFDMCILQGKGRNNPSDYQAGAPNPTGGICNGITSGVEDEQDIAFLPAPYGGRGEWSWRWCEQWIPHSAWLALALATEAAVVD